MASTVRIYYKNGTTNDVPSSDVSYWLSQPGWSSTPPSSSSSTSAPATNAQGLTVQQMVDAGNGRIPTPPAPTSSSSSNTALPTASDFSSTTPNLNNIINNGWWSGAAQGTVFANQNGQYVYKGSAGYPYEITSEAQYQQLLKEGTIKGGSVVGYTDSSLPSKNTQSNAGTSGATAAGTGQPQSTDQYRQALQAMGVDTSGLSDQQVSWLGMMNDYQKLQAANDKNIAPPSLAPDQISAYLDQAKKELGPAYAAQLDAAKQDFTMAAANLTGDTNFASQQQLQAIKDEQKAQADQMAEAGLAYSGIREQAEQKLKDTENGLVRSQASQYQGKLQDLAGTFQKTYGTAALNSLNIPALSYAGQDINYRPYNIAPGFGSAQQTETVAETNRQSELVNAAEATAANAQQSTKLQPLTSL